MKRSSTKTKSGKPTATSHPNEAERFTAMAPSAAASKVPARAEPFETLGESSVAILAPDAPSQEMSAEDRIRHSAYLRFLSRSGNAGSELDDWLQAETAHTRR